MRAKKADIITALKAFCRSFEVNELVRPFAREGDYIHPDDQAAYESGVALIATLEAEPTPKPKPTYSESLDGSFCCAYCPRKFTTIQALQAHKGLAHPNWRSAT